MLHEPASTDEKDLAAAYKARLGIWMFVPYLLFYASFVALNLSSPLTMEAKSLFGLNVATVFGFGLILVALVQALIYDGICRARERSTKEDANEEATD